MMMDPIDSSPRSRADPTTTPCWEDHHHHHHNHLPAAKLRLMCSYGGHIIPRPHDKSLCYVGGDTRIVVVDRHPSLAELHSRLSQSLLNGRHFTLKYQLPTEELDSLISVATDEDLENMIDEYDRLNTSCSSPLKNPTRLRLFLFPSRPDTAASMGCLLDDANSETWFVDALNGSGLLPRGLSESAAIDNLLELDRGTVRNVEHQNQSNNNNNNNNQNLAKEGSSNGNVQEAVSVLDSPTMGMVEMNSSFGSSSSSPSMSNLPPIKVRVEDQMVGLDEQFSSQVNINGSSTFPNYTTQPPISYVGGAATNSTTAACVMSDDERSDQGAAAAAAAAAPSGFRKPPLPMPLQMVQRKLVDIHNLPSPDSKHAGGGYNLTSPDSVASDCSIASAGSLSKNAVYQEATQHATRETRVPSPITEQKQSININNTQEPNSQISMQQLTDHNSQIPSPHQNQQFMHPNQNTHYLHPPAIPMPSYYPIYLPQQTQQQSIQHQTDPQYAMYLLPPHNQTQACYDPSNAASSRALTPPPNPYKEGVYPMKPPENMYSTAAGTGAASAPMYVQVPNSHQLQQQYVGYSHQMHPQAQSHAYAANANYNGHDQYSHTLQEQVYYAPVSTPMPPPQYQTITSAAAMMLSQSSAQIPSDSTSQQ